MKEYKKFIPFDKQVALLHDKKLVVHDDSFAEHVLSSMSYYDIVNGYKECFMKNEEYRHDISIEYLYTFYHFDRSIQNSLFQYSTYVENFFKTALSYVIAKDFGDHQDDYLKRKNFIQPNQKNRKNKLNKTLKNIHKVYDNQDNWYDEPTRHYKYTKDNIPPWILLKNVTFSNTIDLYSFLKSEQKKQVLHILCPSLTDSDYMYELVKNSLTVVRKYRNVVAHNLKFITSTSGVNYIKILKNIPFMEPFIRDVKSKKDTPYSMLLAMTVLLKDPFLRDQLYASLESTVLQFVMQPNQENLFDEYCKIIGMPTNIFDIYHEVF